MGEIPCWGLLSAAVDTLKYREGQSWGIGTTTIVSVPFLCFRKSKFLLVDAGSISKYFSAILEGMVHV